MPFPQNHISPFDYMVICLKCEGMPNSVDPDQIPNFGLESELFVQVRLFEYHY